MAKSWMICRALPLFAAGLLAGCGGSHPLMPLEKGVLGTYRVHYKFDTWVEPLRVERKVSVANTSGYELSGPFGISRLAWRDGVLFADQTANAFFEPSVPLLLENGKKRHWEGTIRSLGVERRATAELTQVNTPLEISGRKLDTVLSTLTVTTPTGVIELDSWFSAGTGLVQQEQRTNGQRVIQLQLVTPPSP